MTDAERIQGLEARLLSLELSRLEALQTQTLENLKHQRHAFIRAAAQLIYIYGKRGGSDERFGERGERTLTIGALNSITAREAWEYAKALWAAKPEDC
jgi:uncharacterized coiled-coil protein SlyX